MKVTKEELKKLIESYTKPDWQKVVDEPDKSESDFPDNNAAVDKWWPLFKRAKFDDYSIDFSNIESEVVEVLGKALLIYFKRKGVEK